MDGKRHIFGFALRLAMVAGVLVLGAAVTHDRQPFVSSVSAAAGDPHIEIAPGGTQSFGASVGPIWSIAAAAPGVPVTGSVELRVTNLPANATAALTVRADYTPDSSTSAMADAVVVTSMSLGAQNLLPSWSSCASGIGLTLANLRNCSPLPSLPIPPAAGATFKMTLAIAPVTGNSLQGISGGPFRFVFGLFGDAPALPQLGALPSPSPSPVPTATATQPPATATPVPPQSTPAPPVGGQPQPPAPPVPPAPQPVVVAPAGFGQIRLRFNVPQPVDASLFTLTVAGENGANGPGPERISGLIPINQLRQVLLGGPTRVTVGGNDFEISLDSVICVTEKGVAVPAPVGRSFDLTLTEAGQVITCTFTASAVAGARTPGPQPEPPAPPAPVEVRPVQPAAEPKIFRDIPSPADIFSTKASTVSTNMLITAIVVLLLLISSALFNQTVEENRKEIEGLFRGVAAPFRRAFGVLRRGTHVIYAGPPWMDRVIGPFLVLSLTGLIYGFLEPGFGFNQRSAVIFLSLVISGGLATYVYDGGKAFMNRRQGVSSAVRLYPAALGIAVVSVALCRLVDFQPGIVFGFIASAVVIGHAQRSHRQEGLVILWPTLAMLVVSLGAWVLASPLGDLANDHPNNMWASLPESAAIAIFVVGLEGLFCVLLPLRFMDGEAFWRWNKYAWLAVYGVVAFLFWQIMFNREEAYFDALRQTKAVGALGVFAAYLVVTVGTWAYFRFREERHGHPA